MNKFLRQHRRKPKPLTEKRLARLPVPESVFDVEPEETECEREGCQWEYRPDWGGDPDIPNGTFDASTYYCPVCDTEVDERPDGYEEPFNEPEEDVMEAREFDRSLEP